MSTIIRAVLIGKVVPLGRRGVDSGIFKKPVDNAVDVTRTGLSDDQQGDKKNHGGPEKAIHHYPFDHYAPWREEMPELTKHLTNEGAFGENISTDGLTEDDVCIGDIYRLGTALVQISQGRQPCWRLNERFGDSTMARQVQSTGRTGWYYRVIEEGRVGSGDLIDLIDRPNEDWTLQRILHLLYHDTLNADDLIQLSELTHLADSWRKLAARRLERRSVEDWSSRLNTPERTTP